jgi:hypothetical protein
MLHFDVPVSRPRFVLDDDRQGWESLYRDRSYGSEDRDQEPYVQTRRRREDDLPPFSAYVREFEPTLVAVPNLLIATLALERLSNGIEYLEEDLVGEAMDCCDRRHVMIGAVSTC